MEQTNEGQVVQEEQTQREPVVLTITQIMADLKNGLTRKKGDINYSEERGSIEEKYNLSKSDVVELFKHSALRNLKTHVPKKPNFILQDDRELPVFGAVSDSVQARVHNSEETTVSEEPTLDFEVAGSISQAPVEETVNETVSEENTEEIPF